MTEKCTDCNRDILDGEGRANTPKGVKCNECSDKYYDKNGRLKRGMFDDVPIKEITPQDTELLKSVLVDGVTDIGGHLIPNTLLEDYKNHVAYLRRVCNSSLSLRDPMITFNALKEREKIHRKIFAQTGLIYHADDDATGDSILFNTALDKYIS